MDGTGQSSARRRTLLGDPERDRLTAVLREHYAAGRLSLDELRRRAEIVFAAAYLDEAEGALAELPVVAAEGTGAGRGAGQGSRRSRPRRISVRTPPTRRGRRRSAGRSRRRSSSRRATTTTSSSAAKATT